MMKLSGTSKKTRLYNVTIRTSKGVGHGFTRSTPEGIAKLAGKIASEQKAEVSWMAL